MIWGWNNLFLATKPQKTLKNRNSLLFLLLGLKKIRFEAYRFFYTFRYGRKIMNEKMGKKIFACLWGGTPIFSTPKITQKNFKTGGCFRISLVPPKR